VRVVLAVSGYAQSGKDTFADAIEKSIGDKFSCSRFKFAESLRKATSLALEHLGIKVSPWTEDKEKKDKLRPVLVSLGEYARSECESVFADFLAREIDYALNADCEIAIITDMRYENENFITEKMCRDKGYQYHRVHITRTDNGPANEAEERSVAKLLQSPVSASYVARDGDVGALKMVATDYVRTFILPLNKSNP
jgi:hypothetical protein